MWFLWLFIIIFLVMIEAMTVGLVSIWFIFSGIVALLLSFFVDSFLIQFAVFVLLGILALVTTRPILEKKLKVTKERTNADRIIGMKGVVTQPIKKLQPGEVKVDGKRWTAISEKAIPIDSTVKILSIEGVKLKVEKVEE